MVASSIPGHRGYYTGMGDRLREGKSPRYFTEPPRQLSLLPSIKREMSTGHSAVTLCGWGTKAVWFIPYVDERVGGR